MAPSNKQDATTFNLGTLPQSLAEIFDQVQVSLANHRKNCVNLHKCHVRATSVVEMTSNGSQRLTGEHSFTTVFITLLSRVLSVKKGVQPADRVVKFVGMYMKYMVEKGLPSSALEDDIDDNETPSTRFVDRLLSFLLKGFAAKDKNARFRSVGLVAELISHLGELDEEVYLKLRNALVERLRDKEASIRSQAVVALARLLGGEDIDGDDHEDGIVNTLSQCLCSDPAPEVRRLALTNIPITPGTLPLILTRTRDIDPGVRVLLYGTVLSKSGSNSGRVVLLPTQLTIAQRELLVHDGLGDREDKVKGAAANMIENWFDLVRTEDPNVEFLTGALEFLKLFDVATVNGGKVAADALRSIFESKTQCLRKFVFPDAYWNTLTAEAALFARCFIEYASANSGDASCSGIGMSAGRMVDEAAVPVITAFAFYIQEACNQMLDAIEALELLKAKVAEDMEYQVAAEDENNIEDLELCEDEYAQKVFILGEMIKIADCLDYGDEIGRRKMFAVIQSIISHEFLPEGLIEPCLDVLKRATLNDKEMIRETLTVLKELRDNVHARVDEQEGVEESVLDLPPGGLLGQFSKQKPSELELTVEEKRHANEIDLRCLAISIAMLKRVTDLNSVDAKLEGIVEDLIVPSIKRCEVAHRELGLTALGLCCLISKDMALRSFPLFCNQAKLAHESLKIDVLRIIFDLLLMHSGAFFGDPKMTDQILSFMLYTFENEDSPAVQAVICTGFAKLMLNGIVADNRVLISLVAAFVSPANAENQQLRQCLAYFIPVYCYSSAANQARMQSIFLDAYKLVSEAYEELSDGETMITPAQFCALFADWTDPQRRASGSNTSRTTVSGTDTHLNLALDILKTLYDEERAHKTLIGDHKPMSQVLSKLFISPRPDPCDLLCLKVLLDNVNTVCSFDDTSTQKAVDRFKAKLFKELSGEFSALDVDEHADDPRFNSVCALARLDERSERQDNSDADSDNDAPTRGRDISPMKPSTRRKTRPASLKLSDEDDELSHRASAEPPLSRSPSPSPLPSPLPTPSPSLTVIPSQLAARGLSPPKGPKRRKVTSRMQLEGVIVTKPSSSSNNNGQARRTTTASDSDYDSNS